MSPEVVECEKRDIPAIEIFLIIFIFGLALSCNDLKEHNNHIQNFAQKHKIKIYFKKEFLSHFSADNVCY